MPDVGLYFGSFNPVHKGHLEIARAALSQAQLSELWFVLSPQNPLKEEGGLWPDKVRLALLEAALLDEIRFKVCTVELKMPKPSYTIDSLRVLRKKYPTHNFSLLMGGDNWASFDRWRSADEILEKYRLWVYPRPGFSQEELPQHPQVRFIDAELLPISSTEIRAALQRNEKVDEYLPEGVTEDYVRLLMPSLKGAKASQNQ